MDISSLLLGMALLSVQIFALHNTPRFKRDLRCTSTGDGILPTPLPCHSDYREESNILVPSLRDDRLP